VNIKQYLPVFSSLHNFKNTYLFIKMLRGCIIVLDLYKYKLEENFRHFTV